MTVMLAFVNGMYSLTKGSSVAGNIMVLSDGALDEVFSDLGYRRHRSAGQSRLCAQDQSLIRRSADGSADAELGAVSSGRISRCRIRSTAASGRRMVQVRGVEDPEMAAMIHEI